MRLAPRLLASVALVCAVLLRPCLAQSWAYCAPNGGTCYCNGYVRICASAGCRGQRLISGSISCSTSIFGDPHYRQSKHCQCKNLGCGPGQSLVGRTCTACTRGRYQGGNNYQNSQCLACGVGYFEDRTSSTGCKACSQGYYTSSQGAAGCSGCGPGTNAVRLLARVSPRLLRILFLLTRPP